MTEFGAGALVLTVLAAGFAAQAASVIGGASFRFVLAPVVAPPAVESPLSLTASDGTGLRLLKLRSRGVVRGPLAFTELRMTFENPSDRTLEGRFRVVLPQGAAVSRFAMRQGERWQEAEVVELQKARAAYEDFLHRRQDPALLEKGAGNEFTARVFPIPARGTKELIVSYSSERARSGEPYVLSLRGLPEVGELDLSLFSEGKAIGEFKRTNYVPASDFTAALPKEPAGLALRGGGLVAARLRPVVRSQPDEIDSLLILVDSSASRALGFEAQQRLLGKLMEGLVRGAGPDVPVTVAAFDQEVALLFEGKAGDFGPDQLRTLSRRGALGASDLKKALAWAGASLLKRPAKRVLLISDGIATAGPTDGEELAAAVRSLKRAGAERLDAIAVGGIRDDALLRRLTTAGLPRDGAVADGALEPAEIGRKLTETTRSGLAVSVKGAVWSWPRKLDGVQAGDEVLVYARVPEGQDVSVSVGGALAEISVAGLDANDQPLLERAAAQAEIAGLLEREAAADGTEAKEKVRKEIVALSVRGRVLSPYTALLVLETEEDYARFGIDRSALARIMTVEDGKVVMTQRVAADLAVEPSRPADRFGNARHKKAKADAASDVMPESGVPQPRLLMDALAGAASRAASAYAAEMGASAGAMRGASGGGGESGLRMARGMSVAPSAAAPLSPPHEEEARPSQPPYTGKYKEIMGRLAAGRAEQAAQSARAWLSESPGDIMALVALGEALERLAQPAEAGRAYGSIIDLYPSRADLRRFAGERLERLAGQDALALALDSFKKARDNRPDHPSSHRLYAFALVKAGRLQEAFDALVQGAARKYPEGRFLGVERILKEDLGLVAAAWSRAEPARQAEIMDKLAKAGGTREEGPSLRFILNWETDANDVDFHIHDARGGHAFYSAPKLGSGGELYADVTTGYGPECFTIRGPKEKRAGPYTLEAHYYSRGPMGYGMGKLEVVEHDGSGGLRFEERPFVVMVDGAFVKLGTVR
jgi:tetratricopeptide (TPR) repeat protein